MKTHLGHTFEIKKDGSKHVLWIDGCRTGNSVSPGLGSKTAIAKLEQAAIEIISK